MVETYDTIEAVCGEIARGLIDVSDHISEPHTGPAVGQHVGAHFASRVVSRSSNSSAAAVLS
jgi:hypothetical protein